MNHRTAVLLVVSILFGTAVFAGSPQKDSREPAVSLETAIRNARRHFAEKGIDISSQYLDSASLTRNLPGPERNPKWKLVWEEKTFVKGGQTFAEVSMDGSVKVTFGE